MEPFFFYLRGREVNDFPALRQLSPTWGMLFTVLPVQQIPETLLPLEPLRERLC
jgi:hypothetical protein